MQILPNHNFEFIKEYSFDDLSDYVKHRRLKLFIQKGTKCATCQKDHTRLILGKGNNNDLHVDLYDEQLTSMLTVGHIIPKSKGGTYEMWNIRPLCHECNFAEGHGLHTALNNVDFVQEHIIGAFVKRKSKQPFKNGEFRSKILKVYKHHKTDEFRFSLDCDQTILANSAKFVRQTTNR